MMNVCPHYHSSSLAWAKLEGKSLPCPPNFTVSCIAIQEDVATEESMELEDECYQMQYDITDEEDDLILDWREQQAEEIKQGIMDLHAVLLETNNDVMCP
jgi:hypothetical protein